MKNIINFYFHQELPVFVFIIVVLIIGIIFGAVGIKTIDYGLKKDLLTYFNGFIGEFIELEYDTPGLMRQSFKFNFLNMFLIWLGGILVFAVPLIPFLVFLKGFVLGFTTAFLVYHYNLKGILIVFASLLPQNILLIPAYVFAAVSGIYLGRHVFGYYRGQKRLFWPVVRDSTLLIGLWSIIMIGGILIETYFSPQLMKLLFKFINVN